MYLIFFINSSLHGHLGWFHNGAAMNNGLHASFKIMFFSGYVTRCKIGGSYGSSTSPGSLYAGFQ